MVLQLNSLWVLVLATLIVAVTCTFTHAETPYSFYEFESKDFISSNSRPIKLPDGYGFDVPLRNIVGTCKIDSTLYIATSSAIYKMVNPSKFVKIIDVDGINKDFTCGDKYLFYVNSARTAIVRIDLTTTGSFSFTPTFVSNRVYSKIRGLAYSNGFVYFTHYDRVSQVSNINALSYQLFFEKIAVDGTNMIKLYTADRYDLTNNGLLYKGLSSLFIQPTDKNLLDTLDKYIIYGLDNIGISLFVDTDETMYFLIDGDYSMAAPQKRVYKIKSSPTDAELIAYCSYGETYDLDGDASKSKCGPLFTYFGSNSKNYFLSNNNVKLFSDNKVSTLLSFEKKLVSATLLDSKTLIVAESAALYLVDLNEVSFAKIAGGDVENIGDGNSYKFASFDSINKIAKKDNFLYIAESGRIRKVDLISNMITTVANIAPYYPRTLTIDDNDMIYSMATSDSKTYLLKISQTGNINIVFGGASTGGSIPSSASACGSSCFWGEMTFGAFSKKSQSVYAMQLSSYREYLCKHSAIDQSKICNQISDMQTTSYKPVILNVAVAGDYVYVFKKFVCSIYSLDLVYVGEIFPVSTYGSEGSVVYVSDREQIFVTDPNVNNPTFYTIIKNRAIEASDSKIKALISKASDMILLDDGSIMYVHPPTNSIKILSPKTCISSIPGLDFAHKCEVQCNGKYSTDADVCSGHGQCVYSFDMPTKTGTNVCKCKTGFTGTNCETLACPSCAVKCFDIIANDTSVCSGQGSCVSLDKCSCGANYYGDRCQYTTCNGVESTNSTVCSGNGVCSGYNNCTCNSGSSGITCEQSTCFGISNSDPKVCSGHGSCVSLDTCKCQNGYTGKQCQAMSCFGVPATNSYVCSGHGTCSQPDACSCTGSFSGTICNITTCGSKRSDDLHVCGSMDSGYCESKDVCVCKPGMTKTDTLMCKKPCTSTCSGVSTYRFCQSYFCAPIYCENRNTHGDALCTANGMNYCGETNFCTFECASDSDCISKEYRQKCDTGSISSPTYRTCQKSCSSNMDCTSERMPVCVDYGAKGSRCERTPCTNSANCTNPAYPNCYRSSCDNIECTSNSDCLTVEGKEFCNKNGTCTAKPCIVSSECADAGVSTYCSYSPLHGNNVCSKVECTTNENCKNTNGKSVCENNVCTMKTCKSDSECPQDGVNKYCIDSKCSAYYPPCVTSSDCSSYVDTPTCDTNLTQCVPKKCKYGKDCADSGCRVTPYSTIYGATTKVCTSECKTNAHCSNVPGRPDCNTESFTCEERKCTSNNDCPQDGANKYCNAGKCGTGCLVDNDCYGSFNVCMAKNGYECVIYNLDDVCESNDDCPNSFGVCMTSLKTGIKNCGKECITSSNCTNPAKPFCDLTNYECKEKSCDGDYDCLSFNLSPKCDINGKCNAECNTDLECGLRPGTSKCETSKFKCITQTCTNDDSCKSYGGGYFPHCVNGMCRHECTKDSDCNMLGKGKCERPANANNTDGGICVSKSCTDDSQCTSLNNRNSFCRNSVCNYECNSNSDCNDKISGKHVCKDNKCINYCSATQPCTSPWFSVCLEDTCRLSCESGSDCVSVQKPKCSYNSTNYGSMCVPSSQCSNDGDCGTSNNYNYAYSKCLNSTCAYCLQNSDCTDYGRDKYYCGLDDNGLTVCTYQRCSSTSDCPGAKTCWKATTFGISLKNPETKVCLDYDCKSDADCKDTLNKHSCIGNKCSPSCKSDSDCGTGSLPTCNTTSNDCTYKKCTSASDCTWGGYTRCLEGSCVPECFSNSDCAGRNDDQNYCSKYGSCINYCDSNADCGNPWYPNCLSNHCYRECDGGNCKSIDKPLCVRNETNLGSKCMPFTCTTDATCSNPNISPRYTKCYDGTCASCKTDTDCASTGFVGMNFCGIGPDGYQACTYKACNVSRNDCPTDYFCGSATKLDVYSSFQLADVNTDICLSGCWVDDDCKNTINKHKCNIYTKKCEANCAGDYQCSGVKPKCDLATGDCTYKTCTDKSQCSSGFSCTNNICVPECLTNSDCKTDAKPKCSNFACVPECTSDSECGKNFCINNKCKPCSADGFCDGTKSCSLHLDGTKACNYKLCNDDSDCKNLFFKSCKPASTFSFSISGLTTNTSATVCSPECTTNTHCKDPKYPTCITKNGVCGPECVIDSDCSSAPNNRKFCNAGTCASCNQIANKDVCAADNKVCLKDASGNNACGFKKCTTSSDCATLGKYSTCTPWNTISTANTALSMFYAASDSVCYYECYAYPSIPCKNPAFPKCDYTAAKCVPECSTSADCTSGGKICLNNKCSTGCTDNSQCGKPSEICQPLLTKEMGCGNKMCNSNSDCTDPRYSYCVVASTRYILTSHISSNSTQKVCAAECYSDSDCKDPNKPKCSSSKCVVECLSDTDCQKLSSTTPLCKQNKCVKKLCETSKDCFGMGFNTFCRNGVCQAQCSSDTDCPTSSPYCTTISNRGNFKYCTNKDTYCTTSGFSTFREDIGASSCVCLTGKSGKFCQIATNTSTCTFGDVVLQGDESTVIRTADSTTNIGLCNCKGGYSGSACTVPERQCTKQCVYGQCVGSGATPKCICDAGYGGELCDSICTLNCVNGTCGNATGIAKCICNPGFEGDLCEKPSTNNPCTLQCVNGQCSNVNGAQKCVCAHGFEGDLCEKKSANPCNLKCVNGECANATGIARCICATGFEGELCDKKSANPCLLPCVNGQCSNDTGFGKCICNTGFEGELCEKESTTPCTLQCVNGQCANINGAQKCVCVPGFEGDLCEKKSANPCNLKCINGQCTNTTGIAKCNCNAGFEGDLCEKESTVPCTLQCVNGQCSVVNGVQKCNCNPGFEGELCEKKVPNPCTLKCVSGQCSNSTGIAKCNCNPGFEGELCDKKIPNPCTLKCANGLCQNTTGIAKCMCNNGFEGELCEQQSCNLKCAFGQCAIVNGVSKCICNAGYEGDLCEKKIPNPCTLKCVNGQCANSTGIAKCVCSTGFEGDLCEKRVCSRQCLNGGSCKFDSSNNQICSCVNGYSGALCQTSPEQQEVACKLTCLNGGVCTNTTGVAKCLCTSDLFVGDLCASCKSGFILQRGVCVCPFGFNNENGNCVRLPADCAGGCGQFGQCTYKDTTGYQGYCKCQENYVTELSTNPCGSCVSGYVKNAQGKCVRVCPPEFTGEDCNIYTPAASCVPIPPSALSFCKVHLQSFKVLNTHYASGAANATDARQMITSAITQLDKAAKSMYDSNLAKISSQGAVCNSTCEESNARLACYSQIQSCNSPSAPETRLCKSVCNYIIKDIRSYYPDFEDSCSNLQDSSCFYGAYLPPDTSCYGKLYTDSSVCNGKGDCVGTDKCICKSGFSGSQCSSPVCFGKTGDQDVCSSNGVCSVPNRCTCNNGFTGLECNVVTCNGKSEKEGGCSYRGVCSSVTRSCVCNGNFDGASCSKCKEGFSGPQCDIPICNGISSIDKAVCGGRGACKSEDGVPKCQCFDGYGGSNCQTFVCNGTDRLSPDVCSSKGKCVGVDTCSCAKNYNPATYCSTCLPSFDGVNCETKKCTPELTCGGRGTCDSQFKCVCSDKFTGPFCERCVDGFVGDKCQYQCSAETTCNRKGTCSNDGSCICSGNAEGANCQTCKSGWFGEKCDFSIDTTSFGFSENGDSITASVMSSLKKRIDCSSLITNSQVLGNNPICSLNGEKSLLTITLGTTSSIIIGGTLNVKKHFDTNLATDVTVAQAEYKAVEPVAVLISDKSTISKACGSIYLDASGSSSLDRRSLIYSWTTTVAPSSTEVLDSIISKQSTPGVKFTAADLDVGTYVVQVTVKSSFSLKESVASVTFSVIAATPPTISIKNGLESSMVIGSPYIVSPIVTFPSCYKGSGNLVYTYTLESGSPIVVQQKNELLVFSNDYTKLTVEGDYVFKLTAKEEGSPEASVTFKVTATALPLKVSFNIRDMTQSFEDLLSFAISKQDPSNPTEAGGQVSLSCVNIDTAATCDDFVNGAQNIDQSTLKFEKSMKPGVYSFTATYTKATRSSTASVKVTVSDQSKSTVLRVSIAAPRDADLVAIDPSNDFVLQASSLDTLTSARLLTWSSSDFTFDASIDISKQYIVIPKSLLAPGASYTVTVKVVDGQKSGEASLSFTVNSPPTMGTFEISPKTGTALTDEFKISCGNGWSDPQLPLSFAFYSKLSSETTWRLLKEKSETRSFGTSLPAGELDIKVMVFDSKGASTETTTTETVSMPKDASSAISALASSSSGTMTTSSLSSALSVIQSVKTDDPELKKQFAEVGKQMVLSYFEQKATEENLSSQTSTSTSSTLSVISSISSCVDNLPDETIRMIIEKFKAATNGASSSSSISLSDEEIKSSTDSASTIQSYVSTSLGGKRSLFASSFTMDDLNKIDQVKNNLLNIKLKNVVPDMPAVRGTGVRSASYVRLVNIASLNGLFESVADNGITKFNLSSVFSEIPQLTSLESVKISMKVYDNTNTTFKSTSKIFDFIVSQTDNSNVQIQYSKSIAQLTIEKTNSTARAIIEEPKCSMVVNGAITDALSSCTIIGTHSDSYVVSITSTGSYVIGTSSTTSNVQPETSTTAENPTPVTPILPKPTTPNLDYIALILLVIPVLLLIVGVVGLIVYIVRRNKGKNHAAPPQNFELRSTV